MYMRDKFIMLGDFNIPLFEEENEHLKLKLEHKVSYPIKDETFITRTMTNFVDFVSDYLPSYVSKQPDFINKNMYRAIYDNSHVIGKQRVGHPSKNSQAFDFKIYKNRQYNTDQIFTNISDPFKVDIYPKNLPLMPFIGKSMTDEQNPHWLSDHQRLSCLLEYNSSVYKCSVLNMLSDCCSDKPPLKSFNLTEVEAIDIEYAMLLSDIYKCCKCKLMESV